MQFDLLSDRAKRRGWCGWHSQKRGCLITSHSRKLSWLHHTPRARAHQPKMESHLQVGSRTCTASLPGLHHSALPAANEKAGGRKSFYGMNGKDQRSAVPLIKYTHTPSHTHTHTEKVATGVQSFSEIWPCSIVEG